jgi:hypothetical protein
MLPVSVTSQFVPPTSRSCSRSSLTVAATASALRAQMKVRNPLLASSLVTASPIPLVPPVTSAVLGAGSATIPLLDSTGSGAPLYPGTVAPACSGLTSSLCPGLLERQMAMP